MNQVKAGTEFLNMGEEEILAALDRFEEAEAEKDEHLQDGEPEDPVVREVGRLISEYTARFDDYCANSEEIPDTVFTYEPQTAIERIAYGIFTDAVHDALQEEDDEDDSTYSWYRFEKAAPFGKRLSQACFFSFLNKSGKRVNQRFPAELQKKQLTGEKNEFL